MMKSFRFFPVWSETSIDQTVGFLELINYVLSIQSSVESWIEIGSYIGESSTLVVGFPQIKRISCIELNKEYCDLLQKKFMKEIIASRYKIINESSDTAHSHFIDNSIDVVYIDSNHSYDFVYNDITQYYKKIKPGGFLTGHDYNNAWPGVKQAVNIFLEAQDYNITDLIIFRDSSWLIRKKQ